MRHGSLFSGIGGFELAAEWMGWENTFHCEFNEFGSKVLNHYWPESKHYGDITKSDFSEFRDTIDILTGGFPCQPYSAAGKRKGKDDARHLWPEMLRVIREVRPRYIVGENVYGLVTWNGGLVFDEVCTDLEAEGYAVWPIVIPAAAVNAPHRRDRVWFVAYSNLSRCEGEREQSESDRENRAISNGRKWLATDSDYNVYTTTKNGQGMGKGNDRNKTGKNDAVELEGRAFPYVFTTDSDSYRIPRRPIDTRTSEKIRQGRKDIEEIGNIGHIGDWHNFPTESPLCSGDDGLPSELDRITFSKWRNESIKAYGNAVVPQVVYQIFKAIEDHDYRAMA
jgi:DNA (cytosine-5)-methyltransferase 1